ncbi:MAG: hypothetical protein M3Y24_02570 [Acidobacteriota bacterium]|nr:hypothetical protein [Acidobacteriota bacterium]
MDNVSPVFRYDRDNFFDQSLGNPQPLTPETAGHSHVSEGAVYGAPPELPPLSAEDVLIMGRFETYHSVLSASHRSIYTEVRISVQKVIGQGAGQHISSRTDLVIAIPGGTVQLSDGRIISYLTDDRQYSIQPDHTYFLLLGHQNLGDFYVLEKSWDVTGGVGKPNTPFEVERANKGQSRLTGLSVDAAVSELKKMASISR